MMGVRWSPIWHRTDSKLCGYCLVVLQTHAKGVACETSGTHLVWRRYNKTSVLAINVIVLQLANCLQLIVGGNKMIYRTGLKLWMSVHEQVINTGI